MSQFELKKNSQHLPYFSHFALYQGTLHPLAEKTIPLKTTRLSTHQTLSLSSGSPIYTTFAHFAPYHLGQTWEYPHYVLKFATKTI